MSEMTRESLIEGLMAKGKTREQAEAFLNLMGSAFRRRGWSEGEPLEPAEVKRNFETFVDGSDS